MPNTPGPNRPGQFQPGQSGNPSGRPKIVGEIKALAREHTETAIKALVQIVKGENGAASARVAAACALLDRGYGRPALTVDVTHRKPVYELTDAELTRIASGSGDGAADEAGGAEKLPSVH